MVLFDYQRGAAFAKGGTPVGAGWDMSHPRCEAG